MVVTNTAEINYFHRRDRFRLSENVFSYKTKSKKTCCICLHTDVKLSFARVLGQSIVLFFPSWGGGRAAKKRVLNTFFFHL